MKSIRNVVHGLVACGIALAMVSTLSAQTVTQGKAKVVRIKGHARYTTGNNVWQPLSLGDVLKPGTVVQTSREKGDFVDLVLGDGNAAFLSDSSGEPQVTTAVSYQPKTEQNYVRIWENSLLGVDKLTAMDTGAGMVSETQLDLKQGHIFGNVKKMSAASKYEVKIPNGVAGIRGTTYDLTAEGVVKVSAGSVVLAFVGADGTVVTQVVVGNQQFDARSGKLAPLLPSDLQKMLLIEHQASVGATASARTFVALPLEHVRHVSPVTGRDPDHDGDNDRSPGGDTSDPPDPIGQ